MTASLRLSVTVASAVAIVLLLTSCTPATFVWGYVGHGSDFRLAFCSFSTATMARITVSERPDRYLEEVQSTVWSGPRIDIPEGAILGSTELPDGWQKTNDLDLTGAWDRIDIELYDGDEYVDFAILDHRDAQEDRWSLSPAPGIFSGTANCSSPHQVEFVEQPELVPDSTLSDVSNASDVALPEDEFWALLQSSGVGASAGSLGSLRQVLAGLPSEEIAAFHARLMLLYYQLDTAAVWNESERQRMVDYTGDSTSDGFFVDFRSAIIFAGSDAMRSALTGESFPDQTSLGQSAGLSNVAVEAATLGGKSDFISSIALMPTMGKNNDGW